MTKGPVAKLICDRGDDLATLANVRYGSAIDARGGVEFIVRTTFRIVAWVGGLDETSKNGGGQRRRTRISSTDEGLSWRCTGNPKDHEIFCKHCVALALALGDVITGGR